MNNDSADLWIAVQLVGARLVVALFVLGTREGEVATQRRVQLTRRLGVLAFHEFRSSEYASIPGLELFDLEYDADAFDAPLPRVRVIPIDEFDPEMFLQA